MRSKRLSVVALGLVAACGGGGVSFAASVNGTWDCRVVEGPYLATPDNALQQFNIDLEREGSWTMEVTEGFNSGENLAGETLSGEWSLDGGRLSVTGFDVDREFDGASADTDQITYDPDFEDEAGTVDIARDGDQVRLSWVQGQDTDWVIDCQR